MLGLFFAMWTSFTAYPGARQLCSATDAGRGMEIHWTSYATRDEVAKVVAFYEKDQKRKAEPGPDGSFFLHAAAHDDDVVTVQPAGAKFATCGETPTKEEKSVIVVSRAVRGGR